METTTIIFWGDTVQVTDEQLELIQNEYVQCHSCWSYEDWIEPDVWHFICELCYG